MQRQPWFAGISGGLAVLLLSTAATAQLPGPAAGNGGAASGQSKLRSQLQQRTQQQIQQSIQNRAQGEVQARVQAHVQSRVEAKLQQRFQDRAAAEVEKAAKAARHAAIAVHRRAEHMQAGDNGVERTNVPEHKVRGNASLATRQEIAAQYGNDFVYADLDAEARAKLPPGFAEADAQALAAVFGNFDAFVGEVPRRERGTDAELSGEVRGPAGTGQQLKRRTAKPSVAKRHITSD